ncbi:hypothetical protein J0J26_23075 [Vibrio vulnificus]|uniref:Uncharacterized protein n=1 Tax=Vibrio vulnificus TaxID=672 RepID=A0AAN1PNB0_VIBVL|nr:hypothetical protein FORC53_1374 [Vibrio vulnificus]MBN8090929.1 hypothetical protein [Vibrio vulnificus]MBN8119783.1 hypothetical protein [Vibrio vulnificus]
MKLKEQSLLTDLKVQADIEVAVYRAKLEQESLRFNVKTSGVYEKQAEVLMELYSQLSDLEYLMNVAINQGKPWDEKYDKFKSIYFEVRTYWRRNRILLSDEIDHLIRALLSDAFLAVENYGSGESSFLRGDFEYSDTQKQKAEQLKQSIPQILELLVTDFRDKIGVTDKNL